MRRTLLIVGALGVLVATTSVVVLSTGDSAKPKFCTLNAIVPDRYVELDGQRFGLVGASAEAELTSTCNHYVNSVILPNCDAWKVGAPERPHLIRKVGPFYSDGTCDGSGGGTLRDDAPAIIATDRHSGSGT